MKSRAVPFSNDTVTRPIKDLAANINTELISGLQNCTFVLQMEESTDVTGIAVLLVFVRHQHQLIIQEDLLWECLATNTSGAEIFKVLHNFL